MDGVETNQEHTQAGFRASTDNSRGPWWKRVDWPTALFLILTPILTAIFLPVYIAHFSAPSWWIIGFAIFMYLASTISITAGYHRLFSHRSYQAKGIVRAMFIFFGASAFQGSVLKWATDHRRHHRKVDTDEDPYSINKGFWYAHMGWLMVKDNSKYKGKFEKDLERDPMVAWQHRHYILFASFACFGFPALIGLFMGDALGGFLFAGFLRVVLGHHATFLINSACHCWGKQPYSDSHSARDSVIMAVLTSGEGYHNFHHQFEADYRNGIKWYHYDPTKWLVRGLWLVGLTSKLKIVPSTELLKYRLRTQEKRLQLSGAYKEKLEALRGSVENAQRRMKELKQEYKVLKKNLQSQSQEKLIYLRAEVRLAKIEFRKNMALWQAYVRTMQAMPQPVYVKSSFRG